MQNDLLYKIGITLIDGVGDINAKKLIGACGSAEEVFKAKKSHLIRIDGVGAYIADMVVNQKVLSRAEKEINFISKNNIEPLFYLDKNYPQRLKQCADSPVMLYYKGNADLNNRKVISIVGTRKATEYGKQFCAELIQHLQNIKYDSTYHFAKAKPTLHFFNAIFPVRESYIKQVPPERLKKDQQVRMKYIKYKTKYLNLKNIKLYPVYYSDNIIKDSGSFYKKYIKYKTKYLQLKNKI